MRRGEERLRTLHPYAMGRYDRLRGEGTGPFDAMRETAPLFPREPHARPGEAGTRMPVGAGQAGPEPRTAAGAADGRFASQLPGKTLTRRRSGVDGGSSGGSKPAPLPNGGLNSARRAGHGAGGSNQPAAEVIARLARAENEGRLAAGAERTPAADLGHAAADGSAREHGESLKAARSDTLVADRAGSHASADRTAARLAAESSRARPPTASGPLSGRPPPGARSPVRTAAAQDTKRPGVST